MAILGDVVMSLLHSVTQKGIPTFSLHFSSCAVQYSKYSISAKLKLSEMGECSKDPSLFLFLFWGVFVLFCFFFQVYFQDPMETLFGRPTNLNN